MLGLVFLSHAISLANSLYVVSREGQKYSLVTVCLRDFPVSVSVYPLAPHLL